MNNLETRENMTELSTTIQQSFCVILCVSEKYRVNHRAQIEAIYSRSLKKPIISLIFQDGLLNNDNGWIDKFFEQKDQLVNFIGKPTNQQIQKLLEKLSSIKGDYYEITDLTSNFSSDSAISVGDLPVLKWDKERVALWLNQTQVHENIKKLFSNLNGVELYEIFKIKNQSPEFYHNRILEETGKTVKLADVGFLNKCLDSLFSLSN